MNIKDIQKKYNLIKDDVWRHQQSGQWILTHNAVEKIASIEQIEIRDIKILNSEENLVRMLISMVKGEEKVTSIGEADRKNCRSQYLGCMAEKRGIDRCVLKLINAYEYGISSEVEADDFAKPNNNYYQKTDNQLEKFSKFLEHPHFDGKRNETKKHWKECNSLSAVETCLRQMQERIDNYDKENEYENQ
tara:strand:- start:2640 stop:3209 length:570 start_codon:yes stop_codon:yes gene_type:complete